MWQADMPLFRQRKAIFDIVSYGAENKQKIWGTDMLRIQQLKLRPGYTGKDIVHKVSGQLKIREEEILKTERIRESIDARKKPDVFYTLTVDVTLKDEKKVYDNYHKKHPKDPDVSLTKKQIYSLPSCGSIPMKKRPVIIGAGPAGLFCAYYLAVRGFRPIILERGKSVAERKADIDHFWETGILDPESNVQFGEGGAGTFSDGKLNTLTKDKSGRNKEVLRLFVQMGAKESILYEQKPHLGTDVLFEVIANLRNEIIRLGGEVRFCTKAEGLVIRKDQIEGVTLSDGTVLETEHCILAIGHSARDTFEMLLQKEVQMEPKSFAVGFRVQHPQQMINESQYAKAWEQFPAASYKLTAQTSSDRGVYSFCMCPGGYVVNASSEKGYLAVNGMSYSGRDGKNANSAIIVSVTPEDFPSKDALGGIRFQRMIEKKAFEAANGKIPIQLLGDFKKNTCSEKAGNIGVEVKGQYAFANLRQILPEECNIAFLEGMENFGHKIQGFDSDDVIMAGVESRTSSPVRITRDEDLMSNIKGLYPCGEGAGYAGGITSAAADGIFVAEKIIHKYQPLFP